MNINGATQVTGVIGNPIEHSISPQIHNLISQRLGKNAAYVPFKPEENNLSQAIHGAHALGIKGLNVTIPFKQKVIPHLIRLDDTAEKVGAVNTLKHTADGYIGYNTDLYGMEKSCEGIEIKNSRAAIVGAGGAAYAAGVMAAKNGASEIFLINRTP